VYAAYLAIHYFRTNSPATGGRFVVTSSAAGLYGVADLPLYCCSKFGNVGMVRSLGKDKRLNSENITFNAICPGWVETGLAPPGMIDYVRKNCPEIITPMDTIMKAFNMCLDSQITGEAIECTGNFAEPRPTPDVTPSQNHANISPSTTAIKSSNPLQRVHSRQKVNLISQQLDQEKSK
jgi:NAD(P)-dependent dehydrogenase (short-subunit alcohol dehydrogenase family)